MQFPWATTRVLSENLHGLEIDQRCVELAAFALALTAWKYPDAGGYRPLPELNVACCGLSVNAAKDEWKQLGLGKKNLSLALEWMYEIFANAPVLGSLINPATTEAAKIIRWEELSIALTQALDQEQPDEQKEASVVAHGLAKAATLLGSKYHWVFTNVPYLTSGKQSDILRKFCEKQYPAAKSDLATVFLDRCLELCLDGGTSSVVLPQNWLFLTSYKKFRQKLLLNETWHLIARLGPGAFETISGEVVKVILINISRGSMHAQSGGLFGEATTTNIIRGLDVSEPRAVTEKAAGLLTSEIKSVSQAKQLENPDARIALEEAENFELLSSYSDSYCGLGSGDYPRFGRFFWETILPDKNWIFQLSTILKTSDHGAREHILYWQEGKGDIVNSPGAYVRGIQIWGKAGIHVSQMRNLPVTLFTGECWDSNSAPIIPKDPSHLPAIWCFCSSPEYSKAVRRIDQKLNVTNATLVKVPFDLKHWTKVASDKYPKGLPKPYSDDPTQWIFHGHPCGSVAWDEKKKETAHRPLRIEASVLHIAVARLLGYRWPAEVDASIELADQQREWVERCSTLLPFTNESGIVCIPSVHGDASAADSLLDLLVESYGDNWSNDILAKLLKEANHADKTLESWLRDRFFVQHCQLFHQSPFIWHIWDGLHDGFAALVNYHTLDRKTLKALICTYLGDWIKRQKDNIGNVEGAEERFVAADQLRKRLEQILEGENPYDIFVRWKSIEKQPIGWNPDINDGVRLNIRPFMLVDDIKIKGAGVLRDKPNIKWNKDRGKDLSSNPWYSVFMGNRINDHHLTLDQKHAAREQIPRTGK